MTNGKENSRNFQISGKKDNRLSIYLILCRKFRLNSPVVTHEEAPGTNLFGCGQLHAGRCSPVPGNFCYPACCSNVQCVHGVLAAHLSKSQKRVDLKEKLSSKRDTASIESEVHWQDRYPSLL